MAASIDGFSALKSTAARMIAAGFSAMTSFIWRLLRVGLVVGVERLHLVADLLQEHLQRAHRAGLELVEQRRHEIVDRALGLGEGRREHGKGQCQDAEDGKKYSLHVVRSLFAGPLFVPQPAGPAPASVSPVIMLITASGLVLLRATSPATTPWRITTIRSATWKACCMMWVMMTTPMPWLGDLADHLEAAPRLLDAERRERLVEQHQLAAPMDEAVELDRLALAAREMLDIGAQRRDARAGTGQRLGRRRPPWRARRGSGCRAPSG